MKEGIGIIIAYSTDELHCKLLVKFKSGYYQHNRLFCVQHKPNYS
jgi:hypothetical protein